MSELLSFDTTLAKKFNEIINDLSLDVKINTTTTDLKDLKSFPEGELVIKSLSTDFQTLPDIEDISGIISTSELLTQDPVSGQMFSEEKIEVKNLKIVSNKSDLEISGNIITKHYPGSDKKSPAMLELKIKSNKLFPKELLQFDSVLAKTYEDEISKLELDIAYDTYLKDIEKKWYLPVGTITLKSLSADFEQRWDVKDIHGELSIDEEHVRINEFIGLMGKSDLEFSGYINNYPGLFRTDTAINVEIGFTASSDMMRAKDFFSRQGEFYLPSSFKEEYLKNFNLVVDYKFINLDFFNNTVLPDMELEISNLRWQTSNTSLNYRDFYVKLIREDTDLHVESFKGKIGSSDFVFNADIENFEPFKKPDFNDLSAQFNITASTVNLNELLEIKLPPTDKSKKKKDAKNSDLNPFDFIYHDLSLELDVGNLYFDDMVFRQLKGLVQTKETEEIILDSLNFSTAGGNVKLAGHMDASDPTKLVLTSDLDITNIIIQKMLFGFHFKNDSLDAAKHFNGVLSANIRSKVIIDHKFNVDLETAIGTLDLILDEGQILNYPPMQELKKYFGDKDLNNIRLGEITNTIKLNNGVVSIPRMEVNSTLGYLFFSGTHNFDSNLEYNFEVPFKLITRAAWSMLIKRHRKEGAPEDEIQRPTDKETLVSLRLVGNKDDGYDVKLGKGKGKRKDK